MLAISALNVYCSRFRAQRAGANDNAGYPDEMRDVRRCEAADGGLRD